MWYESPVLIILWGLVSTTVYDDDDLDDADCDLGLAEGEVLDVVCCVLLAVSVLVPVLVFDGLVVDAVNVFQCYRGFWSTDLWLDRSFLWGKAKSTEGMALNNVSPSMSTPRIFCATSDISLRTFDFFSIAPLLRFE